MLSIPGVKYAAPVCRTSSARAGLVDSWGLGTAPWALEQHGSGRMTGLVHLMLACILPN